MPQAPRRAGIGGGASPVAAAPAMWLPIRKTALSNSEEQTRCPCPVLSLSRSAASVAVTPKTAPRMSMIEAPARSGRPGGPVM